MKELLKELERCSDDLESKACMLQDLISQIDEQLIDIKTSIANVRTAKNDLLNFYEKV